jgi:ketosteroid isomerase-like protein
MSKEIIQKFYTAFQQKDWRAMQSCYHDNATFSDPVFGKLSAMEAKAMWHMLLQSNASIDLTFRVDSTSGESGACHWEAKYIFSKTGRHVHNIIDSSLEFLDGKIVRQDDTFDLWRWSGMALGWPGKLLGWSGLIQNKIRSTAQKGLSRFIQEHPEYI